MYSGPPGKCSMSLDSGSFVELMDIESMLLLELFIYLFFELSVFIYVLFVLSSYNEKINCYLNLYDNVWK